MKNFLANEIAAILKQSKNDSEANIKLNKLLKKYEFNGKISAKKELKVRNNNNGII